MKFMKTRFLIGFALFGFTLTTTAQEIAENAIGLRLGDSRGFGAEISYQRAVLDKNRVEVDFGWSDGKNYDGVKLTGIFQWIWNIEGNFNWYAGPGIGFGAYRFENNNGNYNRDSFVYLSGDVGVEYKFDFPLLLSLDIRPEFGLGDDLYDNDDLDLDVGVGVRYTF